MFAFGLHGEGRAVVTLLKAQNIDWEDMASFTHEGRHFLLVGDVGDRRKDYTLYVVTEPELDAGKRRVPLSVAPLREPLD